MEVEALAAVVASAVVVQVVDNWDNHSPLRTSKNHHSKFESLGILRCFRRKVLGSLHNSGQ